MDAADVLSVAAVLRAYALESGRDLNAANLFAHTMLMRALAAQQDEREDAPGAPDFDADAA
jgi:hypothetical protein